MLEAYDVSQNVSTKHHRFSCTVEFYYKNPQQRCERQVLVVTLYYVILVHLTLDFEAGDMAQWWGACLMHIHLCI